MAEVEWTAPALSQLDAIADYIALDNPVAASGLVESVFSAVERLELFPESGRTPPELPGSIYQEVVVPPCRVFYRHNDGHVLVLCVMRDERALRARLLEGWHEHWNSD